jgi:RNA polymerase sigma factor (sigma-70 family)
MKPNRTVDSVEKWVELVGRIRDGDESSVECLYARLSDGVRRRLYWNIGPQAAEDRVHEIVLVVLEAIHRRELREPGSLMGFVRTVARRKVAAEIRAAIRRRRWLVAVQDLERAPDTAASPETRMTRIESREHLGKVLRSLKPRDRLILIRFYLDKRTPDQICRELGLSRTQFRLGKSRALARCLELVSAAEARRITPRRLVLSGPPALLKNRPPGRPSCEKGPHEGV